MTSTVKAGKKFGTKNRLEALRVQLVAGKMAEQIGGRIRQARLEAGYHRQRDLAERIEDIAREEGDTVELDNQRISDWERGVNKPSDRYMELLSKAVGRDVGWFYGRGDGTTPDLSAIQGFARDDQVDGGFEEFRGHVHDLEERLDRIERALAERAEHDERMAGLIERQNELLAEQSGVLDIIRGLLGVPDGEPSLPDRLAQLVRDTAVEAASRRSERP